VLIGPNAKRPFCYRQWGTTSAIKKRQVGAMELNIQNHIFINWRERL